MCVQLVVDEDLAGVEAGDGAEGLLGEVERDRATRRRAEVDDRDGDSGAGVAGVGHGGVGSAGAGHLVHRPARRAVVKDLVAHRRGHRALAQVPDDARRRCTYTHENTLQEFRKQNVAGKKSHVVCEKKKSHFVFMRALLDH